MELQWGTGQLLQASVVELESGLCDGINRGLNVVVEVGQVLAKQGRVDLLDRLLRGEGHVEDAVERHETRIYFVVATARRRHATDVEHVNDVSEIELTNALVELVALNEELEQGVGRLGSVLVDLRHVEIIDEHDK